MVDAFKNSSQSGRLNADAVRGVADDLHERARDMLSLAEALGEPGARVEDAHCRQIDEFSRHLAACQALLRELTARRAS